MYAIALTSIPPRFSRLGPVLDSLLAQRPAPARVLLCLPERFTRFPGAQAPPALPDGVALLRAARDFGPATKALAPARALGGSGLKLLYCDDDWLYPPGWAAALLAAERPGEAVAATGWSVARLGRQGAAPEGCVDIAQGYSGVLVDPRWLAPPDCDPPEAARSVDDIWLSGQLARQGLFIRLAPEARAGLRPAYDDAHGLQDEGRRHADNMACAALLHAHYGIWPGSGQ
ncbi:MAG: hypothetical protein RIG84_15610 [Roseovarius sp.]